MTNERTVRSVEKMKTSAIFGIVVAAHCVAVGAVLMIQGCGTVNTAPVGQEEFVMPPSQTVKQEPVRVPDAPGKVKQPDVTAFPAETTTYVVAKGDTLSLIAYKYELDVDDVMILNNINDKNMIRVGQKLKLPGKVAVDAPRKIKPRSPLAVTAAPGDGVYVVQSGDSLSKIAVKCKTKTQDIKDANNLTGDRIFAGQKLIIPGGKLPSEPASKVVIPDAPVTPPVDNLMPPAVEAPKNTAPETAVVAPVPLPEDGNYRKHIVQEGEDLYSVGLTWVVSVEELKKINNLSGTTLAPGQVILIPQE